MMPWFLKLFLFVSFCSCFCSPSLLVEIVKCYITFLLFGCLSDMPSLLCRVFIIISTKYSGTEQKVLLLNVSKKETGMDQLECSNPSLSLQYPGDLFSIGLLVSLFIWMKLEKPFFYYLSKVFMGHPAFISSSFVCISLYAKMYHFSFSSWFWFNQLSYGPGVWMCCWLTQSGL